MFEHENHYVILAKRKIKAVTSKKSHDYCSHHTKNKFQKVFNQFVNHFTRNLNSTVLHRNLEKCSKFIAP